MAGQVVNGTRDERASTPLAHIPSAPAAPGEIHKEGQHGTPEVRLIPDTFVERRVFGTHRMVADVIAGSARTQLEARLVSCCHTLIAYESGSRSGCEAHLSLPPSLWDLTHKLVFVPAGFEYRERHTDQRRLSAIYFHFSQDLIGDKTSCIPSPSSVACFENFTIWTLTQKLRAILKRDSFSDVSYFSAIGTLLAHETIHALSKADGVQLLARGGLAPWQKRLVTTYIAEHLTQSIPLRTLAELVNLSPYHFCRAFKQSLGMPPHRYQTHCRIERAKELLLDPDQSITEIGFELGFGETSSFCAAFRKLTGTTPGRFQDAAQDSFCNSESKM